VVKYRLLIPRLTVALVAFAHFASVPAAGYSPDLTPEQALGRTLFQDTNLSLNRNQACATCHALEPVFPEGAGGSDPTTPGFVDPVNVLTGSPVSTGSIPGTAGRLNAPSAGYAMFSPHFHWDGEEGLYVGGQFWNGRAATLAEQAKGPFLNPVEMAMPNAWAVVSRVKENPGYVQAFRDLYGIDLDTIPPWTGKPEDPVPPGVTESYEQIAAVIAAFEKSRVFNRFTSKFDYVLAGLTRFTPLEQEGLELFESEKSQCSACHPTEASKAPGGGTLPPLFTDFTYDNLGVPRNVRIPGNPDPDPGLGGRPEIAAVDPEGLEIGKHKVMGLRNVALTAPYMHNGVFADLEQVVKFYNSRDTLRNVADNNSPGFGTTGWPKPEIDRNVNTDEMGDLGLDEHEEAALVAFMKTLTDGYPEWGNDPKVPPGTPSPFANVHFPPMP
jgi:cytochrome c peroxidase